MYGSEQGGIMEDEQEVLYDPANDYYKFFGVQSSATMDEIRQVYRQRAKIVHPDHNPRRRAWAETQFRQLNDAYTVLADPDLREEYDRQRYFYLFDAFGEDSPPRNYTRHPRPAYQSTGSRDSMWTRKPTDMSTILILSIVMALIWACMQFSSAVNRNSGGSGYYPPVYYNGNNGGSNPYGVSPLNNNNGSNPYGLPSYNNGANPYNGPSYNNGANPYSGPSYNSGVNGGYNSGSSFGGGSGSFGGSSGGGGSSFGGVGGIR